MYLLSSDRAELRHFDSPGDVIGGYAILSHTWDTTGEQSFKDLIDLEKQCHGTDKTPLESTTSKIQNTCRLARERGLAWVWIDTCCIDKTKSVELSEAISSMFEWYKSAEMCFAYLADVPSNDVLDAPHSAFRKARWHFRGWTLQEGIAPFEVQFFSQDWDPLGTKRALHALLSEISGIPSDALLQDTPLSSFSAAQRMSWAASRDLTRVEDEAYSLMGLFDVKIPTIYGEGRNAFVRLQKELLKNSHDSSLFAWGSRPGETSPNFDANDAKNSLVNERIIDQNVYMFATSPKDFKYFQNDMQHAITYTPRMANPCDPYLPYQTSDDLPLPKVGPFGERALPRFKMTNQGLECYLPVFRIQDATIAVLLSESNGQHLGLILHDSPGAFEDPTQRRFRVGWPSATTEDGFARVVALGSKFTELRVGPTPLQAAWMTFTILDTVPPQVRAQLQPSASVIDNLHLPVYPSPFIVPNWLITRFDLLGWRIVATPISGREDSPFPVSLKFEHTPDTDRRFYVVLGTCFQGVATPPGAPVTQAGFSARWAKVYFDGDEAGASPTTHNCATDHITPARLNFRTAGEDAVRVVEVSFKGRGPAANLAILPARLAVDVKIGGTDFVDSVDDVLRTA